MNNITDILNWLANRMVFKYKEPKQSQSITNIQKLLNVFTNISECNLTDKEIDTIIQKYFFDHGFDSARPARHDSAHTLRVCRQRSACARGS